MVQIYVLRLCEEIYIAFNLDQVNSLIDLTRECVLKENEKTSRCNNGWLILILMLEAIFFVCFVVFFFLLFWYTVNYLFKFYAKQIFGARYIEENDQKKKIENKRD